MPGLVFLSLLFIFLSFHSPPSLPLSLGLQKMFLQVYGPMSCACCLLPSATSTHLLYAFTIPNFPLSPLHTHTRPPPSPWTPTFSFIPTCRSILGIIVPVELLLILKIDKETPLHLSRESPYPSPKKPKPTSRRSLPASYNSSLFFESRNI